MAAASHTYNFMVVQQDHGQLHDEVLHLHLSIFLQKKGFLQESGESESLTSI